MLCISILPRNLCAFARGLKEGLGQAALDKARFRSTSSLASTAQRQCSFWLCWKCWNTFFPIRSTARLHDYVVFSTPGFFVPPKNSRGSASATEPANWVEHLPLPFPLEGPRDPASKPGRTACTDMNWRYTLTITWRHGCLPKQEISSSTISLQCIGSRVVPAPLAHAHANAESTGMKEKNKTKT